MRKSIYPILILAAIMATSCTQNGVQSAPQPLTEKQSALLAKNLAGRVAGKPVSCISSFPSTDFTRVSNSILLYGNSGSVVYQNTLPYGCGGTLRDDDILVFEPFGSKHCEGDTIKLVDRYSGIIGGVCRLGAFVPYKRTSGG
jgi:hypothetical protein